MNIGNKYYIRLTRKKRIFTRPTTRIWYLNTYGEETFDYMSWSKIKRGEDYDRIIATVYSIKKDYVELRLENSRIISVHHEYVEGLEKV
ncbi:MAG: hypothetical protein R2685_10645 [Candidatus Nitrosocosmicus sp.]|nr:hypothetical protein [Candidatus Nitrosocosmicus sp.]